MRLFGSRLVLLNRALFAELGNGEMAFWWAALSLFMALAFAFVLYSLGARLFCLGNLSKKVRLAAAGLITFFVFLDLNPLIATLISRVPGNIDAFAVEAGRTLTSMAALVAGLCAANILIATAPRSVLRLFERAGSLLDKAWPALLATLVVCVFVVCVRVGLFEGLTTVSDELSYLKQADIFTSGRLSEPAPAGPQAFFDSEQMVNDGKLYSKYPPGTSLCYLPAVALGLVQAAPVFYLFLNLAMTCLLAYRLFGRRCALLSVLLATVSPFFVCMGESFLSHGPALSAVLCAAYFHMLWLEKRKDGLILLSGLFVGALILIRPVTGAALILPFFFHGQVRFKGALSKRVLSALLFLGSAAAAVLFLLWYNNALTGDAYLFPYQKYAAMYAPFDRFSLDYAPQGALNTVFNISRLDCWLFGFAPSLVLVVLVFLLGAAASWELLFGASFLCLAGAYLFHWFWGTPWYGPLYYYECSGFLIILAARGLILAAERIQHRAGPMKSSFGMAVICVALFSAPGFYASQVNAASWRVHKVWKPLFDLRKSSPTSNAWVVPSGYTGAASGYLGAAPEWMTGGVRILNNKGGPPEKLKAVNPEKTIYTIENLGLKAYLEEIGTQAGMDKPEKQ